jgi:superfamily II DNA helicase RecQ
LKSIVDSYLGTFRSQKDKIIIYCSSIKEVKELSSLLDCTSYYSNQENNSAILAEFKQVFNSHNQVLVTSTSLIEGFDYSSIRVVIIKDFSYSLIDYIQASGRAGRDNKMSVILLFYKPSLFSFYFLLFLLKSIMSLFCQCFK